MPRCRPSNDLENVLLEFPSEQVSVTQLRTQLFIRLRSVTTATTRRLLTAELATVAVFGCGLFVGGSVVWLVAHEHTSNEVISPVGAPKRESINLPAREAVQTSAIGSSAVADNNFVDKRRLADARHATNSGRRPIFRGSLRVDSLPAGAQVFVNGRAAGTTPLLLKNQSVGSRAVRIALEGYEPWASSVQIVTDKQARLRAQLRSSAGAGSR